MLCLNVDYGSIQTGQDFFCSGLKVVIDFSGCLLDTQCDNQMQCVEHPGCARKRGGGSESQRLINFFSYHCKLATTIQIVINILY